MSNWLKHCLRCGMPFFRRDAERAGRFASRKFCSRDCSDPAKGEQSSATAWERFDSFIGVEHISGCWLWSGLTVRGGYGRFRFDGRWWRAPRLSYFRHKGPIPDGLQVRHTCDTPACVNPDHLILGTSAQNAQDKVDRNRVLRGTKNPVSKLSEEQVLAIRSDARPYPIMAREHGVSTATICNVRKRKVWRHVEG